MKAITAALALATLFAAAPSPTMAFERTGFHATRDHGWRGALPEHRIERILYREGFAEIVDLRLRRDHYRAEAIRPNGAVFLVDLDARDGTVLGAERIGWARADTRREPAIRHTGMEFRFGF